MSQHLEPCPHCGEHCMSLVVDQGDKWAHYEPSCTEVRTGYDLSPEAPWRAEAVAAWNTRTPPKTQAPDAGATPDTSTLPPQGDLGNSGGLIERLRKTNLTFITTDDPNTQTAAADIAMAQARAALAALNTSAEPVKKSSEG